MLVSKVLLSKEGSTLGDTQQFGEDDIIQLSSDSDLDSSIDDTQLPLNFDVNPTVVNTVPETTPGGVLVEGFVRLNERILESDGAISSRFGDHDIISAMFDSSLLTPTLRDVIGNVFNFSQNLNHPFLDLYLNIASANHLTVYSNLINTLSAYGQVFINPNLNIMIIPQVFIERLGYLLVFTSRNLDACVTLFDFAPIYTYVLRYHAQWLLTSTNSLQAAASHNNVVQTSQLSATNVESVIRNEVAQAVSSRDLVEQADSARNRVNANVFDRLWDYMEGLSQDVVLSVAILGGGALVIVVCIRVGPHIWRHITELNYRPSPGIPGIIPDSTNTQMVNNNNQEDSFKKVFNTFFKLCYNSLIGVWRN